MNRLIPLLAGALLWAGSAHAQDKTYTLTVTTQDLQVLSAGLDELQRKVSEPVVEKLQKQLIPQMQPAPQAAVAPPQPDPPKPEPAKPEPPKSEPAKPSGNPHPSF